MLQRSSVNDESATRPRGRPRKTIGNEGGLVLDTYSVSEIRAAKERHDRLQRQHPDWWVLSPEFDRFSRTMDLDRLIVPILARTRASLTDLMFNLKESNGR